MRAFKSVCSILFIGLSLLAQQAPPSGAKALFFDTQTGKVTMPTVPQSARNPSVQVPAIMGLMYYLELISTDGELVRVNSNRAFHSGDRFRLHVTSNIDGWLTILQSQGGAKFEKLFPTAALPGLASNVKKGIDTILPSPGGWFKFDDRPGEIRVLMMLTAEPTGSTTQVASNEAMTSENMRALEQVQRGSKALLIESSDSAKEGYEVRVVNSTQDRKLPPGQIVVELKLQHSPRGCPSLSLCRRKSNSRCVLANTDPWQCDSLVLPVRRSGDRSRGSFPSVGARRGNGCLTPRRHSRILSTMLGMSPTR